MHDDDDIIPFDPLSTASFIGRRLDSSTASLGAGAGEVNAPGGEEVPVPPRAEEIEQICWNARYRMERILGNGAQGVVYLARRDGADGFETKVAVKFFFRDPARELDAYVEEMRRVARQAQRISQIQNDNLVTVRDFVSVDETRVMVMEWVDGLDLRQLLHTKRYRKLRERVSSSEWERLNDVVVSEGVDHCRLKAGIAVDIVRGCLAGLSDLHHQGIVHCDMKPSNIMIKRTGTKKIVDLDSSCVPSEQRGELRGTPYYMAPEQLRDRYVSYASDIASLGYVLIEMLTGRLLFHDCRDMKELLEAKLALPKRLPSVLPTEVLRDPSLFRLVGKMVAVDPAERFPDADAADLDRHGAASFHRNLIKTDLSTEYDRELAWWLDGLLESPARETRD